MFQQCSTCKITKVLEDFHKDKYRTSGRTVQCKLCRNTVRNAWKLKTGVVKKYRIKRVVKDGFKFCTKCNQEKLLEKFPKSIRTKSGVGAWCSNCMNTYTRKYIYCKETSKKRNLEKNYNLTVDCYNLLQQIQEHKCSICKGHKSTFKKALSVDHNHKTGKVRGLLCGNCNRALGYLKEKISIFNEAIKYLEIHNGPETD